MVKVSALSGDLLLKLALVAAGAAVLYIVAKKAGGQAAQLASRVGTAINPASPDNVVNQGVNAVGRAVTGSDSWTLGGWIYDSTHSDPMSTPSTRTPPIAPPQDPILTSPVYDPMGNPIFNMP